METETPTSTIPPIPDNNSRAKVAVLAAMALGVGGGDYYVGASGPQGCRGPSGASLKVVGASPEGHTLLEDSYGRQYTRDAKGTIRRVESKKA